jgi:hypothetical protein
VKKKYEKKEKKMLSLLSATEKNKGKAKSKSIYSLPKMLRIF